MVWDITAATARVPAGSNAVLIQTAFDMALALAEKYCDRQFLYKAERATFTHPFAPALQLSRYPIEQIVAVTGDNTAVTGYHMEAGTGRVVLDSWAHGHQISVDYAGGYKTLPADLEFALWSVFDTAWTSVQPGGSASAAASGGIASVTVPDVGTIRFDTGAGGAVASGGAAMGGLIPSTAASILDLYRLRQC